MNWLLRKLPILAALIAIATGFIWLDNDSDFKREVFPPRSLHNISPRGASLAFRYLKESRGFGAPGVNELHRMIDFAKLEPDAVVLRIGPEFKPGEHLEKDPNKSGKKVPDKTGPAEPDVAPVTPVTPVKPPPSTTPLLTEGEKKWVESGGRLVLALDQNYGQVEVVNQDQVTGFEKTFDLWPGVETFHTGAQKYSQAWQARTIQGPALKDALTIFNLNGQVFAARLALQKGEVILIAAPEIFANSHVGDGDNLKLLTELAPATRPIYFDEYVHGLKGTPGMIEMLVKWGMGMALLILCAGSAMAFWRARTPIGPPEDDHKETRTEAIDFVNSLAPLYNRALEPHQAIALHYKNFVQTATAQSGLRGAELREKIFGLLGVRDDTGLSGKRPLTPAEFYSLLKTLNEAYGRLERAHRR